MAAAVSAPAATGSSNVEAAAAPATGSSNAEAVSAAAAGSGNVEFIRADSDEREYRRVVLANALEVLVISDPDTDKAAACMEVAVGWFSDPEGLEGLAHFLGNFTTGVDRRGAIIQTAHLALTRFLLRFVRCVLVLIIRIGVDSWSEDLG